MTIALTDKEAKQVAAKRKKHRPSFYSSDLRVDVEISEDFEAVLILLDNASKQKISEQLQSSNQTSTNSTHDAILMAALNVDAQNAQHMVDEADQSLAHTQTAVETVADERFLQVSEMGSMRAAMQVNVDEFLMARQRAFHDGVMSTLLQRSIQQKGNQSEQSKERDSWRRIVSEYNG